MDEYKYIVNIDNDEMILSLNHTSWADMMEDLEIETEDKVNQGVQQKTNLFFDTLINRSNGLERSPMLLV